jgi:hypothetical protein
MKRISGKMREYNPFYLLSAHFELVCPAFAFNPTLLGHGETKPTEVDPLDLVYHLLSDITHP